MSVSHSPLTQVGSAVESLRDCCPRLDTTSTPEREYLVNMTCAIGALLAIDATHSPDARVLALTYLIKAALTSPQDFTGTILTVLERMLAAGILTSHPEASMPVRSPRSRTP
jgi:hypothetical protein